ncbi:MAG TPA: AAA family ATPase, partial [Rubrobacteraceae bacterium]|nr:AAA family ATPase [Rubrobacteraceae bacterium]
MPSEGAIGVVGPNGSGKTTIFEAILWAFFGSRGGGPRFANDSIPWSGGSTAERTLVEVTLNVGGAAYKVTRALQRGKTEARVFVSDSTEPLVSGSSEVGEWVQGNLLCMDRTAFEATFFARQKELEFFAGVTGVERQREIARILGISQVEEAQKLLRADRKELKDQAFALENLLEGIDHEGLKRDLEETREELGRLRSEDERLRARLAEAEKELSAARAEGERLEEDYRRHNELSGQLTVAESEQARAAERAKELREVLAGLDADEKTVEELKPRVETLPGVVKEIEALEEARWRRERLRTAEGELGRRRAEAHRAVVEASNLIEELDGAGGEPLPGWDKLFLVEDEAARMREVAKVLGLAE